MEAVEPVASLGLNVALLVVLEVPSSAVFLTKTTKLMLRVTFTGNSLSTKTNVLIGLVVVTLRSTPAVVPVPGVDSLKATPGAPLHTVEPVT